MTDKTNTTKAQKTDIEGLLGADKVKPLYERGSFWLVLLILLGILFALLLFLQRQSGTSRFCHSASDQRESDG